MDLEGVKLHSTIGVNPQTHRMTGVFDHVWVEVTVATDFNQSNPATGKPDSQRVDPWSGKIQKKALTMSVERIIVIGDSVAWGQGLAHDDKFANTVAKSLTNNNLPPEDIHARSGAPIGINLSGNPLDIDDQTARSEVPYDHPTITQQVDNIPNPESVDLVLVSGGINDINMGIILNPDTEHVRLEELARKS
jgi:hypothetical protein